MNKIIDKKYQGIVEIINYELDAFSRIDVEPFSMQEGYRMGVADLAYKILKVIEHNEKNGI